MIRETAAECQGVGMRGARPVRPDRAVAICEGGYHLTLIHAGAKCPHVERRKEVRERSGEFEV